MESRKTAILFSGGLDSTYAAFDILSNTADDVTLVRFDFTAVWGPDWERHQIAEAFTAPRIVDWLCSNVRPVKFETVPIMSFRYQGWFTTEYALWAAEQCAAGLFDRVVTGNNAEHRTVGGSRRIMQKALFARFSQRGCLDFPYIDMTKVDVLPVMPPELRALTISCITPETRETDVFRCNECNKCKNMLVAERGLAAGLSPEVVRGQLFESILANPIVNRAGDRKVHADFKLWHLIEELPVDIAAL